MSSQENNRRKINNIRAHDRGRIALFFFCLCALFALIISNSSTADAASTVYTSSDFRIDLDYGMNHTVRKGRDTTFRVTVSSFEKDLEGTCTLRGINEGGRGSAGTVSRVINGSEETTWSGNDEELSLKLSLHGGDSVSLEFPMWNAGDYSMVEISLKNEEGRVQCAYTETLKFLSDENRLVLGIVEEMPEIEDSLEQYEAVKIKTETIFPSAFPAKDSELDFFDALILRESAFSRFKKEQTKAFDEWIKRGGRALVIRTVYEPLTEGGPEAGEFTRDISEGIDNEYEKKAHFIYSGKNEVGALGSGVICRMEVPNGYPLNVDRVLSAIFGKKTLERIQDSFMVKDDNIRNVDGLRQAIEDSDALSLSDESRNPDLKLLLLLLTAYLLIAGPGIYLLLKTRKLRNYLWPSISALSLVFGLIVILICTKTRFKAPFINYVRILTYDEDGSVKEQIPFLVAAPYNYEYKLYLSNEYSYNRVKTDHNEMNNTNRNTTSIRNDAAVSIAPNDEETLITIREDVPFDSFIFWGERNDSSVEKRGITGSLKFYDGELTGEICNKTGYDLRDLFFVIDRHMAYIREFPREERIDISEVPVARFIDGYESMTMINFLEAVYAGEHPGSDRMKEERILERLLTASQRKANGTGTFFGIINSEDCSIARDSAYTLNGYSVMYQSVFVSHDREFYGFKRRYYDDMEQNATGIGSQSGSYSQLLMDSECVVQYMFPEEAEGYVLSFTEDQTVAVGDAKAFDGQILLYNRKTKTYDSVHLGEKLISAQVNDYLLTTGTLRVKFVRDSEDAIDSESSKEDAETSILLPSLTCSGRLKK